MKRNLYMRAIKFPKTPTQLSNMNSGERETYFFGLTLRPERQEPLIRKHRIAHSALYGPYYYHKLHTFYRRAANS